MPESEAFARILIYARDFAEGIERCRTALTFNAADCEDAYIRLSRLRDRYLHEKLRLTDPERQALQKVFEHDPFIRAMLALRQVGEHVERRGGVDVTLLTTEHVPWIAETSAGAFFEGPIFRRLNVTGQSHTVDHLWNLEKADDQIQQALARAKDKET